MKLSYKRVSNTKTGKKKSSTQTVKKLRKEFEKVPIIKRISHTHRFIEFLKKGKTFHFVKTTKGYFSPLKLDNVLHCKLKFKNDELLMSCDNSSFDNFRWHPYYYSPERILYQIRKDINQAILEQNLHFMEPEDEEIWWNNYGRE